MRGGLFGVPRSLTWDLVFVGWALPTHPEEMRRAVRTLQASRRNRAALWATLRRCAEVVAAGIAEPGLQSSQPNDLTVLRCEADGRHNQEDRAGEKLERWNKNPMRYYHYRALKC
jgi:hypothetical protein